MPPTLSKEDIRHRKEFAQFAAEHSEDQFRSVMGQLYENWREWNQRFFDGKMVEPYLLLTDMAGASTLGDFSPVSGFGGKAQIRLRMSILSGQYKRAKMGSKDPEGLFRVIQMVLLHEQIHQFVHEILGVSEESFHGHGPVFRDECNRIGTELGFGKVRTAKKRGGDAKLPSCAHWPDGVIPNEEEYYRGAWPIPKPRPPRVIGVLPLPEISMDSTSNEPTPGGGETEGSSVSGGEDFETHEPEHNPIEKPDIDLPTPVEWKALFDEGPKLGPKARKALDKLAAHHGISVK